MSKRYKSKKILVKRQYQILAAILFLLAAGLVLLPKYQKVEGVSPEVYLIHALSSERYITTDQLAEKIINQDPTLLLVDTRDEQQFNAFTLPNAINVPIDKMLDEDHIGFIDQEAYDVILFSNDNFLSDEVWMISNRLGFKNLYVLKGGLNEWFSTIITPDPPKETDPKEAFELYNFRKAAGMYFGVGAPQTQEKTVTKKKVITVKKKKKRVPEGGC